MILGLGLLVVLAASVGGVWYGRERERQASYEAGLTALAEDRYADALTLAGAYPDDPDHDHLAAQVYLSDDRAFRDAEKGLALQRAAAEAGQMRAAYFLARYLLDHDPDETQRQDALRYLTEAAECGMPAANLDLGVLFTFGENVEKDYRKARGFFEKAAMSGLLQAQKGLTYVYGKTAQTMSDADGRQFVVREMYVWAFVAANFGDAGLLSVLREIEAEIKANEDFGGKSTIESIQESATQRIERIKPSDRYACASPNLNLDPI